MSMKPLGQHNTLAQQAIEHKKSGQNQGGPAGKYPSQPAEHSNTSAPSVAEPGKIHATGVNYL